jgi:hypothetical protein
MATVYTKTDNYGLNLYGDNDPADLRDGYNGSMRTIDTTLENHLNRIEGVESRETHDEAVMKALLVDNTVDNATAAKTKWDKASTDAVEAMADAADAAEKATANANTLASLQGTVSSLSDTVTGKANAAEVYTKAQADARYTQQGGYSGTAQTLNQRVDTNTSDISRLKTWNTAFSNGWANLGDFTYTCQPSSAIGTDSRSNIKCLYNEEIGAIKLFGMFAVHPISGQSQNFTSLSVVSQSALPVSMRPSSDVHMDAALAFCMNGLDSSGAGSYTDIVTIPCCVTVKTSGYVLLGEVAKAEYHDAIQNHARQSFRVLMPQCIYTLAQ